MSTVGVDIGDWTFEKKMGPFRASHGSSSQHAFSDPHGLGQPAPNYGPVVFRTWDFGGQTEYYATHQYFLSKRSLYLVVWKVFLPLQKIALRCITYYNREKIILA